MSRKANIDHIHDMLVAIDSRLDDMAETLVRNDANLALHMKRSDELETVVDELKKQSNMVQGIVAFVVFISVILSIIEVLK